MFPFINVFGRQIGTYGVCMVAGFVLVFFLALRRGKSKNLLMEDLLICAALTLGFALVCGSLLFAFVTYPAEYIWASIKEFNFKFLSGGIVFYGGLIGGIIGAFVGRKIAKCSLDTIVRSVVPYVPLGHAIGRVGCVMAGCCHGSPYEGPFALHYPHSVLGLSPEQGYFPVQLLEGLINVFICLILCYYEKKAKRAINVLFAYLGMYAISRFFLEMLRGDAIRGVWHTISTSQYISIALLAISVVGLIWGKRTKKIVAE